MDTYRITEQCKQLLQDHYGNHFAGLVLYGSMARNEASPDSDIDLLVLLNQSFDYISGITNHRRIASSYPSGVRILNFCQTCCH